MKTYLLIKKTVSVLLFSLFGVITAIGQTTINCPCVADASISEADPSLNLGDDASMIVGKESTGEEYCILIKFDLSSIPTDATINDADLKLTYYSGLTSEIVEGIEYRVTSNWNESTVDYMSLINYDGYIGSNFTTSPSTENEISIAATNFVKDWIEDGEPNYGLVLIPETSSPDGNSTFFHTKESNSDHPVLEVTYTASGCSSSWDVSSVSLNGGGNSVTVNGGETIDLDFNYSIANSSGCPGCIQQIVIGWDSQPIECAYDNSPEVCPSETNGTYSTTITAPSSNGTYGIYAVNDLEYNCSDAMDAYPNDTQTQIGTVTVTSSTEPNLVFSFDETYTNLSVNGTNVDINVRVINEGSGSAGSNYIAYYLSTDEEFTDFYVIGDQYISSLNSGDYIDKSFSKDVTTVTPNIPPETYYVGMAIDCYDDVSESNENDNGAYWPSPQITIYPCMISSYPYNEGFETDFPPECWSTLDEDGDGHNWEQVDNSNHT
ncbi:MAG: DNRLRE domain-containing protein, partial [bacterium]